MKEIIKLLIFLRYCNKSASLGFTHVGVIPIGLNIQLKCKQELIGTNYLISQLIVIKEKLNRVGIW